MTALASTVSGIVSRFGEAFTIRRVTLSEGVNAWTAGASSTMDATVRGFEGRQKDGAFRGGLVSDDAEILLDAATCAFEPQENDLIARAGSTAWQVISGVKVHRAGGSVRLYALTIRK